MDAELLFDEMRARGVTKNELCAALNMSRSAFYRKCKGLSEFTLSEIQGIVDYLSLASPGPIFFSPKVS